MNQTRQPNLFITTFKARTQYLSLIGIITYIVDNTDDQSHTKMNYFTVLKSHTNNTRSHCANWCYLTSEMNHILVTGFKDTIGGGSLACSIGSISEIEGLGLKKF